MAQSGHLLVDSMTYWPQPVYMAAVVALLLLLIAYHFASRRARRRADRQHTSEFRALRKSVRRPQDEERFMTGFLREFPQLMDQLSSDMKFRDVPHVLADIAAKTFRPERVLVLLQRGWEASSADSETGLVLAAAEPESALLTPGLRLPIERTVLGEIVRRRQAMARADIERLVAHEPQLKNVDLPHFDVDLAAPLVIESRSLGLLLVSRPDRHHDQAKEVLRLIAHLGAFTLHNVRSYLRIKSTADVDSLTGIYNKRVLTNRLGELVYEAEQNGGSLAIFLFDIDHFKNYNDKNGHVAGDNLLRSLAKLVDDRVRADDIFGRFGGEEFLVIMRDQTATQAALVAEYLRQAIEAQDFPHRERQPTGQLTISGGVAAFPEDAQSSTSLLKRADDALYRAKAAGRNRVLTCGEVA